jgi:hypothetical protein
VLPIAILDVKYEEIVTDVETQARRMIEFLGLPWDPACVQFPRSKSSAQTSSVWQVRQPIHNASVGRWRRYEKHLGPLLKALEP